MPLGTQQYWFVCFLSLHTKVIPGTLGPALHSSMARRPIHNNTLLLGALPWMPYYSPRCRPLPPLPRPCPPDTHSWTPILLGHPSLGSSPPAPRSVRKTKIYCFFHFGPWLFFIITCEFRWKMELYRTVFCEPDP